MCTHIYDPTVYQRVCLVPMVRDLQYVLTHLNPWGGRFGRYDYSLYKRQHSLQFGYSDYDSLFKIVVQFYSNLTLILNDSLAKYLLCRTSGYTIN